MLIKLKAYLIIRIANEPLFWNLEFFYLEFFYL
jgi:hypothetical protein